MRLLFCIFIGVFSFSSIFAKDAPSSKVTYVYDKDMEGSRTQTTWVLTEKDNELRIEGESVRGKTMIMSTPDMDTRSFNYASKDKQNAYNIIRTPDGQYLIAKRDAEGQKVQRNLQIGNDIWIQEFDFSLKPFILSNVGSFKFYIIHPQRLDLHHMQASKERYEQVEVNGKMHEALKVKITLTGFKKMFWKAQLWFDQETGDLLKYMANEGPNTPMSIITLFSKKTEE